MSVQLNRTVRTNGLRGSDSSTLWSRFRGLHTAELVMAAAAVRAIGASSLPARAASCGACSLRKTWSPRVLLSGSGSPVCIIDELVRGEFKTAAVAYVSARLRTHEERRLLRRAGAWVHRGAAHHERRDLPAVAPRSDALARASGAAPRFTLDHRGAR
jgi:hypothetical protein